MIVQILSSKLETPTFGPHGCIVEVFGPQHLLANAKSVHNKIESIYDIAMSELADLYYVACQEL